MPPTSCFTPLSTRLLSSGGSDSTSSSRCAPVWCPSQDLLAVLSTDGWLHVHRLNWGRILSVEIEAHDDNDDEEGEGACEVSGMAWRADGKTIALGCRCGRASILSIEAKRIVAEWTPADSENSSSTDAASADPPAPITCVRWVDAMHGAAGAGAGAGARAAPGAPLLQALYLRAQGAAPRGLRRALQEQEASAARACLSQSLSGSSNSTAVAATAAVAAALPPSERVPLYFGGSLPPLDSVLDIFNAASLPAGAVAPNAAAAAAPHQHRSARSGATGPPAGGVGSAPLRDVLHDALDFSPVSMPLLLLGDARGRFWLRAFGTLDVLTGRIAPQGTPVLAMDWCGLSGTLSVAGRRLDDNSAAVAAAAASFISVSAASLAAGAGLTLQSVFCAPLLTRSNELCQLAQHVQQVSLLRDYIAAALQSMLGKWTPARRSFHNKMAGLGDVIDEFANDAAERRRQIGAGDGGGEDTEEEEDSGDEDSPSRFDRTDAPSELLHLLLTGVPSYTTQQFITRYLSAGPMLKTMDGIATAFGEMQGLATVALARACEQLVYRVEQLRAHSCTSEFRSLGLDLGALNGVLDGAGAFWTGVQSFLGEVVRCQTRYAAFGTWMVAAVRLVNNEHDSSPAPSADASEAEKEGQSIPSYGPHDTGLIAHFIRCDLGEDQIGRALGDMKNAVKDVKAAAAKGGQGAISAGAAGTVAAVHPLLPGMVLPCSPASDDASSSSSLCHVFARFARAFDEGVVARPRRALAAQCRAVGVVDSAPLPDVAEAAAAATATSAPLTFCSVAPLVAASSSPAPSSLLLQQCRNLTGTSCTVALGHASSRTDNKHEAAWLWTHDPASAQCDGQTAAAAVRQEQFVSVLQYRSVSASAAAVAAAAQADVGPSMSIPRVLSIHVPCAPDADGVADTVSALWSAQVVSVQFYTDHELALLVQYQHDPAGPVATAADGASAAGADPPPASAVSTKLWLVDLDECDDAAWVDVDALAAAASDGLAGCVSARLKSGAAPLSSLCAAIPCTSFPDATLTEIPSRSRLFPGVLGARLALSGARGLGALLLSGRGAPAPPSRSKRSRAASGSAEQQRALLLQANYKPTRRVVLLDLAEDPEADEEDEDGDGAAEAANGEEEDGAEEEDADAQIAANDADAGNDDNNNAQPMDEDDPDQSGIAVGSSPGNGARSTRRSSGRLASATGSPMMLSIVLCLVSLLALLCVPSPVHASEGDRDPFFRFCRDLCVSRCRVLRGAVETGSDPHTQRPYATGADPFDVLPETVLRQWDATAKAAATASANDDDGGALSMEEAAVPRQADWFARNLFGWDCAANCGYECMHANEARRQRTWAQQQQNQQPQASSGQPASVPASSSSSTPPPTWKYYGKWPFTRVLGFQELFSSLFSVANALPHIYWFLRLRRRFGREGLAAAAAAAKVPASAAPGYGPASPGAAAVASLPVVLHMLPLWGAYSAVYCNTWLWSTVFHARDLLWTERLDYFCASIGLSFSLAVVLIRIFDLREWRDRARVFLPVCMALLVHISYLQWVHFDYGWNMRVSLCVGLLHSTLWIGLCMSRWGDGYHARMLAVTLLLWACAALEVFDFPPWARLLDAHAIWHGLTPALGYMFYAWVEDDLAFQLRQELQQRHKHV